MKRLAFVSLFVVCAARARTGYEPSAGELALIGELVRRLDGLPLAIELAAARSRILSVAALVERLVSRFQLLSAGPRDVEPRQRTLRAAIDASWVGLTEEEKRALRWSAVFRGGFTLDAFEHVVGVPSDTALSLVEAVFPALFGLWAVATRRLTGWPIWFAGLWALFEWLQSTVPFGGFPWGVVGFGQSDGPLLPLAQIGGAPLVSSSPP